MRILRWNKRNAVVVAFLILYGGGVALLLFKTFIQATWESSKPIKVSIVDFKPLESRELSLERQREIEQAQADALAVRDALRPYAEAQQEVLRQSVAALNAADQRLNLAIDIETMGAKEATNAEDAAILASLQGIGPVDVGGRKSGGGSQADVGPPIREGTSRKVEQFARRKAVIACGGATRPKRLSSRR